MHISSLLQVQNTDDQSSHSSAITQHLHSYETSHYT